MFSKPYLSNLKPSSTLVINEQSKKMQEDGREIFKFGFGQSPFPIPQDIVNKLKDHAFEKDYLPVNGLLSLRKSIVKHLEKKGLKHFNQDNIFVGPGTKQLMFLLQIVLMVTLYFPRQAGFLMNLRHISRKIKYIGCKQQLKIIGMLPLKKLKLY